MVRGSSYYTKCQNLLKLASLYPSTCLDVTSVCGDSAVRRADSDGSLKPDSWFGGGQFGSFLLSLPSSRPSLLKFSMLEAFQVQIQFLLINSFFFGKFW